MKIILTFVGILVILTPKIWAQNEQEHSPKFALKIDVPALIDPFNMTFLLSGEYKVSPYVGLQLGAGYIFHNLADNNFTQSEEKGMSGFKVKLEPRIYLVPGRNEPDLEGPYLGVSGMYKKEIMDYEQSIIENGYSRLHSFTRIKTVLAVHVIGGYQLVLGKRIILDFYGGFGSRIRDNVYENYIGTPPRRDDFDLFGGIWGRTSPSLTLGFRFGVAL